MYVGWVCTRYKLANVDFKWNFLYTEQQVQPDFPKPLQLYAHRHSQRPRRHNKNVRKNFFPSEKNLSGQT